MKFLISIALLFLTLFVQAETFPPLTPGQVASRTFAEMWAGFDPRAEPLDVEVLKAWEEDDVVMQVLRYRAGVFKGKKAMIAAVYGYPKGAGKLPGLVQIHGGGQYADYKAVLTNGKRGYATISIAWAGRIATPDYLVNPDVVKLFWDGKTDDPRYRITTDWGALDGYHAPSRNKGNAFAHVSPHSWTLDAVDSARNNPWFLAALAARRALTFLEQQPQVDPQKLGVYGHSMGGKLTVFTAASDERVKAAAPSCGGISDRQNERKIYQNSISDKVLLSHVKCPVIFLNPANDFHGRVVDLDKAVAEIQSKNWRITSAPHHNHQDTAPYEVATQLWFDQHLKGSFKVPASPRIELKLSGVPEVTVIPDTSREIVGVDFFYTQESKPVETSKDRDLVINRFWHHRPGKLVNGQAKAILPLMTTDKPLWVYANIRYALEKPIEGAGYYYRVYQAKDFNLSSLVEKVSVEQLKASKARAIDEPSLGIEDFKGPWVKNWFSYHPERDWSITTHKINDPKWTGPEGASLFLGVQSDFANKMAIRIDDYLTEVELKGGAKAQIVMLKESSFQNVDGEKGLRWSTAKELELSPQEVLRSRDRQSTQNAGGSWQGNPPSFKLLKWVSKK
ncbi:dienelactone hydrolase family protein [Akkermansiaceae bacterium]|nr:dienelactone hydrolase family protein [Akkermansiaceae bacterium]MDB4537192.1 dienelactone hydrolase family protein [Akkermansiaceae bacterium]